MASRRIRTTLLDSEEHVCPTCNQSDVSPDNLIANKFLRQAVNTFKKEQSGMCGTSQSQNPTQTSSPVPTPPPLIMQSQTQKLYQSSHSQQDPLVPRSEAADTPSSSQVCGDPPTSNDPDPASNTPSTSLQPTQSHLDIFDNSTSSSSSCPTRSWSESFNTQQLPPSSTSSSSSYPAVPPPLFPSPLFHTFLAAQQPLNSYHPGYPPATPVWTLPTPQGAPIPSLCSSTSASPIPALIPKEWYMHQRNKKERSPHRGSAYRRSSSRSNSKSSKVQIFSLLLSLFKQVQIPFPVQVPKQIKKYMKYFLFFPPGPTHLTPITETSTPALIPPTLIAMVTNVLLRRPRHPHLECLTLPGPSHHRIVAKPAITVGITIRNLL
ncbi:E3 ubiquitin-protein ligase RBBP6 [Larimichthys crocea]|uniref:Uncharacterized protein n=1 Tax=Larimichthys crocea TaxID=215358 RepID=A0ACD3R640_LARCR|nr:E3 ubiquitin-protein ligase RBBP6 [Larimichthys crocea]